MNLLNDFPRSRYYLLAIQLLVSVTAFGQSNDALVDTRPLNSVSINLFGDASLISLNYERQFVISPSFILTGKFGLGYNEAFRLCFGPCVGPDEKFFTVPHHITGNFGKGKHFFEFGLGGTFLSGDPNKFYLLYPMAGYRLLPLKSKKVNFRIYGQLPIEEAQIILFSPFGISLGISFS